MSEHNDKRASGADQPESNDRREFIRKSFGVAPLMLTLGSRSYGGGTSMHGTLWSSLGTKWKHKGDWWRFKKDGWRWTKNSGDQWRERDEHTRRESKDDGWRRDNKIEVERKDWDWKNSDERWQREMEAEKKRKDSDWSHRSETSAQKDGYDWRADEEWKRSRRLASHDSDRKKRDKD